MNLNPEILKRVRVLAVDDDEDSRRLIAEILERSGACVTSVASAEEAFEEVDDFLPDVVVTDVFLPGKSGRELADDLKSKYPAIRTMGFSGAPYFDQTFSRSAFVDFVQKPCSPSELVRHVALVARDKSRMTPRLH